MEAGEGVAGSSSSRDVNCRADPYGVGQDGSGVDCGDGGWRVRGSDCGSSASDATGDDGIDPDSSKRDGLGSSTPDPAVGEPSLVLVVYVPRRGVLELWLVPYGRRLKTLQVGGRCRLLQLPQAFASWEAQALGQEGGGCWLLSGASGTLVDVRSLLFLPMPALE